jgi:DNA-binding XRE family transcriptional regulator
MPTLVVGMRKCKMVIMKTNEQTIALTGETEPKLPLPDAQGNYPAVEALRVVLARKISRRRRAAGLSQVELAKRAGIRPETLNRLEQGKHTPTVETINKIDRALTKIEKRAITQ